jgi:hypothetical protein
MFASKTKRACAFVLAFAASASANQTQHTLRVFALHREAEMPCAASLFLRTTLAHEEAAHVRAMPADSSKRLAQTQPRSALFHKDSGAGEGGIDLGWMLFGMYVLVALIFGGLSGYTAIAKGLNPVSHFFIGLIFSAFGYFYVLTRPRVAHAREAPSGLAKVHVTHEPMPCGKCGYTNHPAAKKCLGCGAKLQPIVASEVARRSN